MKIIKNDNQYQFIFEKNLALFTNLIKNIKCFENVLAENDLKVSYDEEKNQITIFKKQNGLNVALTFYEILPVIVAIAHFNHQSITSILEADSLFQESLANLCELNEALENTKLTSLQQYTKGRYADFPHHHLPDSLKHQQSERPYNCNQMNITIRHPVTGAMHILDSQLIAGEGPDKHATLNKFINLLKDNSIKQIVVLGPANENNRSKHYAYYDSLDPQFMFVENIEKSSEEITVYEGTANSSKHISVYHFSTVEDKGTFQFVTDNPSKNLSTIEEIANIAKTQPVLIHCSAGLGRTGAFILGILLHNHFDLFAGLDVHQQYDLISQIWDQMNYIRPGMIQNKAQFVNALVIADTLNGGKEFFNSHDLLNLFFLNTKGNQIKILRYNEDKTEALVVTESFGTYNSYVIRAKQMIYDINELKNLIHKTRVPTFTDSESESSSDEDSFDFSSSAGFSSSAELVFLDEDISELKKRMHAMLSISPKFLPQENTSDNPVPPIHYVASQMTFIPAQTVTTTPENSSSSAEVDHMQIGFN